MNTEYSADVAVDKWMVQDLYRLRGGMCTSPATSWSNKLRRHVAATNRFVCTGEFCDNLSLCNRILSQQQVAQILSDLIFCDLFSSGTKFNYVADFHKNSLAHLKRFLAATCRRNVLLQLVAECVPIFTALTGRVISAKVQNYTTPWTCEMIWRLWCSHFRQQDGEN